MNSEQLTLFAVDSHAKTFRYLTSCMGGGSGYTVGEVVCGKNTPELLARVNQDGSFSKIHPCLFSEDLKSWFPIFTNWGMMLNGEVFSLRNSDFHILDIDYTVLPTPSASDSKIIMTKVESYIKYYQNQHQDKTLYQAHLNGMTETQSINLYELMMGFPKNWTETE